MIQFNNVSKSFGQNQVLSGINFSIALKDHVVIRGASGSGKSTFLHLLGGLDSPTEGEVIFNNVNLSQLGDDALARYRNESVGFVFQFHYLLVNMTCLENILLPARIGQKKISKVKDRVFTFAKKLGIEGLLRRYPYELSGGEQQRINVLRALSLSPTLLLCDEPTGNLDAKNSAMVIELTCELAELNKSTLIVVTHDEEISKRFQKQNQFYMEDGQIRSF